jgi:hypothetical protein
MPIMERDQLLHDLLEAAQHMLQGSLSQTTRTCGTPGCRCHRGQRHGPHTYLTFRTPEGRSSGVYVAAHAVEEARQGVAAWGRFRQLAAQIARDNRQAAVARWREVGAGKRRNGDATT